MPARRLVERRRLNIVVLQADDRQFGLVVDGINDTEEIVVKPLASSSRASPVFAGATIMGDGKVALILDVLGIAQRANVVAEVRERGIAEAAAPARGAPTASARRCSCASVAQGRMAIPLSLVARLEEFPRSADSSAAGGHEVVQYRGEILPLVRLGIVPERAGAVTRTKPNRCRWSSTHDQGAASAWWSSRSSTSSRNSSRSSSARTSTGLLGSAVIQGRVTELLDVRAASSSRADPNFFDARRGRMEGQHAWTTSSSSARSSWTACSSAWRSARCRRSSATRR